MLHDPYEDQEGERREEHGPFHRPPIYQDYFFPRSVRPIIIPIPIRPPVGRPPFGPGPGRPPFGPGPMIPPWEAPWFNGEPFERH